MINTKEWMETVIKREIVSIVCDKCKKIILHSDILEYQEIFSVRFTGGYGSIFGDESNVTADFCQHCLKEMIGQYCRIDEGG